MDSQEANGLFRLEGGLFGDLLFEFQAVKQTMNIRITE